MAHVVGACLDLGRPDQFRIELPKRLAEWRAAARCYWGDFYPLTPYSLASDAWIAWQFDLPEAGEGVVQAFRRAHCPSDSVHLRLRGLDPRSHYTLIDFDDPSPRVMTGQDLTTSGLLLTAVSRPAALLLRYGRRERR
jgi:alpha-galactosidase